jgi:hypothetical protein
MQALAANGECPASYHTSSSLIIIVI